MISFVEVVRRHPEWSGQDAYEFLRDKRYVRSGPHPSSMTEAKKHDNWREIIARDASAQRPAFLEPRRGEKTKQIERKREKKITLKNVNTLDLEERRAAAASCRAQREYEETVRKAQLKFIEEQVPVYLGVTKEQQEAARELVKTGYRALSLKAHPDVGGTSGALIEVTASRDWLLKLIQYPQSEGALAARGNQGG